MPRASASSALVVESANGNLYGTLRFARFRWLRAEFSLDVVNAGDEQLLATIYARTLRGDEVPVEPIAVWIGARTEAYVTLGLGAFVGLGIRSLVVKLQGPNVHQRLEAAIVRPMALAWAALGAVAASGVIFGFATQRPQILALSVPGVATAGSTIVVPYAAHGRANGDWMLADTGGHRIASGTLAHRTGVFSVQLPAANDSRSYTLRLRERGWLGSDSRSASIAVLPAPPKPTQAALRISSLSVDNPSVVDGGKVTIRYATDAHRGRVELVDAQGTVWASQPLARDGTSLFSLPYFGGAKELQARVIAQRGTQRASAGIGVYVHSAAAAPQALGAASLPGTLSDPILLTSESVRRGGVVIVRILRSVEALRLTLADADGRTLVSVQPPRGASIAELHVPTGASGKLAVIATYQDGHAQTSTIKQIEVVR